METPNAEKYFTVGEAAKKMGVSVRTLQYYHKIGLLPPSGISEGGAGGCTPTGIWCSSTKSSP